MKKFLKHFLLLTLLATSIKAASDKTFTIPRPHGVNLAMEYTTWSEILQTSKNNRFGFNIQAVPFYQDSVDENHLGKYFGIHNKHTFKIGYSTTAATQSTYDVNSRYIFHDYSSDTHAATERKFSLKYRPSQEAYGSRIDYYQDLSNFIDGLYFKVAFPIVHVQNDMGLNVFDETGITKANITNYFKGTYKQSGDNAQSTLNFAKIDEHKSTTQLADVDFLAGCRFINKKKCHVAINLGVTIPSGNAAHGIWTFEPLSGNGYHWGFGGGVDARANIWTGKNQALKLEAVLNYRYIFQDEETRTIALADKTKYPYSQYYLLVKKDNPKSTPLTPAANVFTRKLEVDPGSQVDAIIAVAYSSGGFRAEIGYNFFMKNDEAVSLVEGWPEGTYGIAKKELQVTGTDLIKLDKDDSELISNNFDVDHYDIRHDDLDLYAAASPEQDTHKIYVGIGYATKDWRFPVMIGVGGHYELAYDHQGGIQNWGFWGKVGIGF